MQAPSGVISTHHDVTAPRIPHSPVYGKNHLLHAAEIVSLPSSSPRIRSNERPCPRHSALSEMGIDANHPRTIRSPMAVLLLPDAWADARGPPRDSHPWETGQCPPEGGVPSGARKGRERRRSPAR